MFSSMIRALRQSQDVVRSSIKLFSSKSNTAWDRLLPNSIFNQFKHVRTASTKENLSTYEAEISQLTEHPGCTVTPVFHAIAPEWNRHTQRSGLLARKVGMSALWDEVGRRHAVTILVVDRCHVLQVKPPQAKSKTQYFGVQLGAGVRRPWNLSKPLRFHCAKAGVEPKDYIAEFQVSAHALLPVGFELRADHFKEKAFVDVWGITVGKGFQGVMKRWGFKGLPKTHGTTKKQRSPGSIGSRKPSRVLKGKKMPGRMGGKPKTILNLQILRIDPERNLIYVKGHVPGNPGNWVKVRDAIGKHISQELHPLPSGQQVNSS